MKLGICFLNTIAVDGVWWNQRQTETNEYNTSQWNEINCVILVAVHWNRGALSPLLFGPKIAEIFSFATKKRLIYKDNKDTFSWRDLTQQNEQVQNQCKRDGNFESSMTDFDWNWFFWFTNVKFNNLELQKRLLGREQCSQIKDPLAPARYKFYLPTAC